MGGEGGAQGIDGWKIGGDEMSYVCFFFGRVGESFEEERGD